MSSDIEFRKCALKIPNPGQHPEALYVGFSEIGCNNVIEYTTNLPAREWICIDFDQDWCLMQKIIKLSMAVESGCLKPGGRDGKPENYIRGWRSLLGNAVTIEQYLDCESSLSLSIVLE